MLANLKRRLADEGAAPSPEPEGSDIVEVYSFSTGLMVLLMILWSSFGHQVARRTKYMGEGSAACALGLITGLCILITQRYFTEEVLHQLLTFNPADFFTYFLPPIIFYAGLSVKKKQFFRNFVSIATFGILGTYIAFAVIAFVLYGFSKLPNILTLPDCLALGVIFAATDSVAVLQVLKQDKMPLLYSLVFGEGVINDATSVALLRAVQALSGTEVLNAATIMDILLNFMYLFVASLILGLAFGLGTSWLMKAFKSNSTPQEVALVGLLGYLSYLTGELMGLSGIVTLFCCAVAISHYALHNVSSMSRVTIVSAFQTLSYVSEGAIFIYVGMDMLDPIKWKNTKPAELTWLFCVLLFLMVMGRAAFVFPFSYLHNWWAKEPLTVKEVVVIWYAGLIRGAVSVALVYYYFDPAGKSEDSHRATLITTTLMEVMTSIFVFGAATKPLLDYLLGPEVVEGESSISMELMAGRRRSRTFQHSEDGSGPLYTVVSVAPHDEVANHLDLPDRLNEKKGGSQGASPPESSSGHSLEEEEEEGETRLLGSHGQNLLDLAENMPPAMAVQGSSEWKPSPRSQTSQKWGFQEQGPAEDTGAAVGKENGAFEERRSNDSSQRHSSRSSLGPHRRGQSLPMQASGSARWPGRATSQGAGPQEDVPVLSPFQNTQQQPPSEPETGVRNTLAQRTESLPNSRIHNWWTTFDARYMQPVFGGAPGQPAAAVELHVRNARHDHSGTS